MGHRLHIAGWGRRAGLGCVDRIIAGIGRAGHRLIAKMGRAGRGCEGRLIAGLGCDDRLLAALLSATD